jgi:hypothetical protein
MERPVSKGASLYEENKKQQAKALAAPQLDNDSNDSDSATSQTKRRAPLSLKERKERRKESLSARLKAAGIEGIRKGSGSTTSRPVGAGEAGGTLPEISSRKVKVTRTSSQGAAVRLTRRVGEPLPGGKMPTVKK